MRILLITQFYPPIIGGEERHVRSLAHGLVARGHDVTVATLGSRELPEHENDNGVQIRRLRATMQRLSGIHADPQRTHAPPFPDPELAIAMKRLVGELRPEIIHAHNWIIHAYLPWANVFGIPLVRTLHDYSLVCAKKNLMRASTACAGPSTRACLACATGHYGALKGAITLGGLCAMQRLERARVDLFIAVSRAVARDNRLHDLPHEVIPNFVPDELSAPTTPSDRVRLLPEEPFILFVGDLMRLKGVGTLLDAYRRLISPPPLVLIGRRLPDTPGELPPGVHLFESWPHEDVLAAWQRCLVGVAPSVLREACATVIIEAMTFGKPVIASAIGGNTDLIEPGVSGLLFPPGDVAGLTSALEAVVGDTALRLRLSEGSVHRVEQFKASSIVGRIENAYERIIGARRPAASTGGANA
jgi:glycosyltransferase involved in cell wall biosynthesis